MSALTDFWGAFTSDVVNAPAPSLSEAVSLLQTDGPTLTNLEAEDWFKAVAVEYNKLGLSAQNDYSALVTTITSSGKSISDDLFAALQTRILELPESGVVDNAVKLKGFKDEDTQIPADITTIENAIAAENDPVLKDALQAGIEKLKDRKRQLQPFV